MSSVPSPRSFHFSAARNRSTFYWGGSTWDWLKKKHVPVTDLEYLYELEVVGDKWKKHLLKGQHPPGVYDGACAAIGDCLYLYGGVDKEGKHTDSLFELNLSTKSWRELSRPGAGGPKKKLSCGMVAYNSTLIIYGGAADDGLTNELHMFDLKAGTWSSPHVTGDVPPPDWSFTFTKVSNHQVVLRGGLKNADTYVLDLSRMHWEKDHRSGREEMVGHDFVAACLGLGSDHAQLLLWESLRHTAQLLDVATWKWMKMKLPHDVVIPYDCSATAIQTSPTTVEVVLCGNNLLRLKFAKRASAPEGVSPVQWWILTEYTTTEGMKFEVGDVTGTELSKPTDPQTSSNTPEKSKDNVDEVQAVSANKPDTIFTSSSEMQSEKTSKETDEVAAQSENIDDAVSDEPGFVSDVIEAVDQNRQIQRKMANIILKGLPEAGKSTLLNRLLKKPFQKSYFSTGISGGIVVVDIQPTSTLTSANATSDNSSWEVIDFDASMYSQLEDLKQFLPSAEELSVKEKSSNDSLSYQVHRVSHISEVPDNIKKVLSAHNIKSIQDLKMKNSLYIRDTGGQVEFQESVTLLIYGPSIFIFVLRTDIDIYKKNIFQYRAPSGKIINRYQSAISTVDALVQFLTSVSAIDTTTEGVFQERGVYRSHKPIVFIVGTHIDKLESRASSVIAKINESLDILIRHHNFSKVVRYANRNSSKVMYTVDNTSDKDDNFEVLRRDVNKFIGRREFTVLYPVSYLLSCLELQSIKDTVISMDRFKQLVSKFNITSDQVNHLLQFLHFRIGIIQHYDVDNLSDIVIKEPQVLFNKVTDLLVKTFLTDEAMNEDEQTSFCHKGILEASSFQNILESNDKITTKQFLAFMVHLRLAVSFTDKTGIQKYFIPSVLNHAPNSACEERKTGIAPLCICFQLGHCPQGLFGVLISHLVNPDTKHEFSFALSEDKIYQDQVSLEVNSSEDVDEISLKRYLSHIEVTMYLEGCSDTESESFLASRSISPTAVCTTVHSILQDCLQLSLKTLHYDIKKLQPIFCLPCLKSNCPVERHKIIKGKKSCFMYCNFSKKKCEIASSGLYWFNGGASNPATGLESAAIQKATVVSPEITQDGGDSKATAKILNYLSSIQEQYQKNLQEQVDQEIICNVAKDLHGWDTKCYLLKLDLGEVKDIKEEYSSPLSQRIAALNLWKNRVGPLGTCKNLLRILALGEWHDSAKKIITFINNGSHCRRIACSSGSEQLERSAPGQKRYSEQSETIGCSKHPRIEDHTSDAEADRR